jgi:3-hydroxyacyl-CoA dehydrogenase/enoyl-CoA hydratase/carnithine racemase
MPNGQVLHQSVSDLFPDEVVTKALVRDVDLGPAGTMALITLDNGRDHTRPNTFGPASLLELDRALDEIAARCTNQAGERRVTAVGVTGKPFIFAAGADLSGAALVDSREKGLAIGRLGHAVFRRLGELGVPTFAFVNGAALGGGLEVALHCTYRTISSGIPAIALPETALGLVPGWGGSYLLPHLIGPAAALKVIIENPLSQNKMLRGPQAFELGIADAMFEPADFLEESLRWAAGVLDGSVTVSRADWQHSGEDWGAAVGAARFFADGKLHGAAPAPYRALDLVAAARDSGRDEAFAAEDEVLAGLLLSEEFRASVYAFDLVQKRARKPAGAPEAALARPVTKVGIIGAGLMAAQIALLFVRRLHVPVLLNDIDEARAAAGVGYVHGEIAKLASRGRISADEAARLTGLVSGSVSKDGFADADFVIEAVFEDLDVKRRVFAEAEAVIAPHCVLATNTSSLSVSAMADGLLHPERVVGFHFFNPVAVLPLVEVVRAGATDDATLATALAVGKQLRKNCVIVKDSPAFVVNRLLTRFLGEITMTVEEGTSFDVAEHAADPLGLPMPPFLLLQLVGPAIALHVAETLHDAYPDRFAVSGKAARAGRVGEDLRLRPRLLGRPGGGEDPVGRRAPVHLAAGAGQGAGRAGRGDPADA